MTKKKTTILTVLIASLLLSGCSIGKKNKEEPEDTNLTIEAEHNKPEEENKTEDISEDNSNKNIEIKENRLVLPEVEVDGY